MKGNHRAKLAEMAVQFNLKPSKTYASFDKGHGRVEERIIRIMPMPTHLKEWPGVKFALELTRKRYKKGKESTEVVYGITSLSQGQDFPKNVLNLWRAHWGIENCLHRTRDMAFDEDRSTLRKGNSPQIMAALRNLCIQIAKKSNKSIACLLHIGARFPKRSIKLLMEN